MVLDPDNGMLLIEVKGGILRYNMGEDTREPIDPKRGLVTLKKSPFDQCSNN